MDIYTLALYAVIILILVWRVKSGFKKGLVAEIKTTFSIIIAFAAGYVIKQGVENFLAEEYGKLIALLAVLLIILLLYKIVHFLFDVTKLFVNLPVIKGIDKILGIAAGIVEAVFIIFILIELLRDLV